MRILFRFILVSMLLGISMSAAAQSGPCAKDDYDCQVAAYTKLIAANPSNKEAYYSLGSAYHSLGKDDLAVTNLTKYIALQPDGNRNLSDGYMVRGNCYHTLKQFNLALADYSKAMVIDPDNSESWYNRGLTYQDSGQSAKAIVDYDKYISMNTENKANLADGYNNRALAYAKLGNLVRAVNDYTLAIETYPDRGIYYSNRALVYRKQGKISLAKADEDKAASLPKQ